MGKNGGFIDSFVFEGYHKDLFLFFIISCLLLFFTSSLDDWFGLLGGGSLRIDVKRKVVYCPLSSVNFWVKCG